VDAADDDLLLREARSFWNSLGWAKLFNLEAGHP
jgi:hypothetical protein